MTRLRQNLVDYFDKEELYTLSNDLGVNYDELRGETLSGKARELILYLERQARLAELLRALAQERPGSFDGAEAETSELVWRRIATFDLRFGVQLQLRLSDLARRGQALKKAAKITQAMRHTLNRIR